MNYFYPADQQNLFTNRVLELGQLKHALNTLQNGPAEHMALFGLRRIGKTLLVKELIRQVLLSNDEAIPVYMDFSILSSSPENFALGYVGSLCYWLIEKGQTDPEPYLSASTLPVALARNDAAGLLEDVQPILQELERAKPDRQALLRQTFRFPRLAAAKLGKRLVVALDEFQEIRTLENFPDSQNVLALFRAEMQTQSGILYFLAGSAISILTHLLSHPDSPLFAQFSRLAVNPFPLESTRALVDKLIADELEPDVYPLIHSLTMGHPYYIIALCRRLSYLMDVVQRPAAADTVRQAFLIETLAPGGRIYDFCRYVYDLSLQKASGYGSLKAVLQILAVEEGLTASQVGRRLRVTAGTASDYLRWLCEVDLIQEKDHLYFFRDQVLRFWVGNVVRGIEVSLTAEPLDLKDLMGRLNAQFQRASEELGIAQESLIRELMRSFNHQSAPGKWFGQKEPVYLPVFQKVSSFTAKDGQIQLDAVTSGSSDRDWVVEVKWKSKRAGKKEIEKLLRHVKERSAQGWYISKGGFTSEAEAIAAEQGLYLSDDVMVHELARLLQGMGE